MVQSDPYRLARDIYGVGFKTADRLARQLGLPADHPSRIEAGLVYALNEMTDDGHVYSPQPHLAERAVELLEVPADLILPALERLAQDGRIRREARARGRAPRCRGHAPVGDKPAVREPAAAYGEPAVYLASLYYGETGVAQRLHALNVALPTRLSDLPPAFIGLDQTLSPEQQGAIRTALSQPLSVLTGGPGTGKTTCIRALIAALETGRKRYALASPTGRAARRLSEASGRPASTIHRLLAFKPGEGFTFNEKNPLAIDLLVVDEASMLDLLLANSLLKALQPGTHLLLVGDADQLPSVGAGDVLRDVIASDIAPVTRLSVIFRQAAGSHIITNAHRINQGQMPLFPKEAADFFLFPAESPEEAAQWVQDVACRRIPERFGLDPLGAGAGAGAHVPRTRRRACPEREAAGSPQPPRGDESREAALRADLAPGRQGDADPE